MQYALQYFYRIPYNLIPHSFLITFSFANSIMQQKESKFSIVDYLLFVAHLVYMVMSDLGAENQFAPHSSIFWHICRKRQTDQFWWTLVQKDNLPVTPLKLKSWYLRMITIGLLQYQCRKEHQIFTHFGINSFNV